MKLSYEDKVALLDGKDVWHTKVFEGVPSIMMTDGPHGLRKQVDSKDTLGILGSVKATAFPPACLTACSFDRALVSKTAELIAIEAQSNEVNIVLGPGINIKRSPLCGRNFEYFSEDPYLTGELAAAYIKKMEEQGTGTAVKHFFCNNQEKNRFFEDSIVDERAMREIYLKAFERAVKEKPGLVMSSYNKINGYYASESPVLQSILRDEWGFDGVIVTDWGATHNRIHALLASTDLEMPSSMGYHTHKIIQASINDEDLRHSVLTSADRILRMIEKYHRRFNQSYDSLSHHEQARQIARESMVLLKNNNMLPLDEEESVAIIGGFVDQMRYQGGGSSHINPNQLDQITDIYETYSKHIVISKGYGLQKSIEDQKHLEKAIDIAQHVDKVVLLVGLPDASETEGFDRKTLDLPKNQIHLLKEIKKVNKNIIVVAITGSVINMDFEEDVQAILLAYLGGQAASSAILDLLYGKDNPSGRLAETFIDDIKDCNVQLSDDNNAVYYDESIYIGYRYYQTFNQKVRFPFGYGLSYTTFEYSHFRLDENEYGYIIHADIKNVGTYPGKEVIQIYIENNKSSVYKAKRELKAFDKIDLDPNASQHIEIQLGKDAFQYFDIYQNKYILEQGEYQILIARHVNDVIHAFPIHMKGEHINHQPLSYLKETYDTSDFNQVYVEKLPPKQIKKKRPFNLSSTVEDVRSTLIGKIITSYVIKEGLKATAEMKEDWMREVAKHTLLETPIRMLALFSGGKFSLHMAEGMVDIINLNWIKGIKKIRRDSKEKKANESTE